MGFSWHLRMFSVCGPPATWCGELNTASFVSASQVALSVTGVVKLTSADRKQKSTAAAGFAATTWSCVRTPFRKVLGAVVSSFDSHVSMVVNDLVVIAAICAGPAGSHDNQVIWRY